MNYEWSALGQISFLLILSGTGVIIGASLMSDNEPNNSMQEWVKLHVSLMFACLCILASLLFLQVIALIL